MFFNHDGRSLEQAVVMRDKTLAYLTRLFENKAQFAAIAKDHSPKNSCLLLRGYVHLNSPCKLPHIKQMLGKYSSCYPSYFGDMVSLCRLVHVDKYLTTVGRLPQTGISTKKNVNTDTAYIVKVLVESIEKRDYFDR